MKYLYLISFFILCVSVQGQVKFEDLSWKEALEKANKEKKIVYLNACTSWSEPCQVLEKYTLADLEAANFYNDNFINISLDMEQYPGIELGETYAIEVYPVMLFVDAQGEVVHRGCGAVEASEFLEIGRAALGESNLQAMSEKYDAGTRDADFLMEYLTLMDDSCLDAEGFATEILRSTELENLIKEEAFILLESYQWDIFSREFKHLVSNREQFEDALGKERVNDKIFNTYLAQYQEIFEAQELHLFGMRALLNEVNGVAFSGSDTLLTMMNLHYYEVLEDWENYSDYAVDWVGMAGLEDPEQLGEMAWNFYLFVDSKEKLTVASSWAKSIIDSEPSPSAIDTYASLLYKLGDKKKAIELEKQAVTMAQELLEDTAHYAHQLKKFQED